MNKLVKFSVLFTLLLVLGIAAFFWNESRKEIVFLCGNLTEGTTEQSVRSQLDTGSFLRYSTEYLPTGRRITVESAYNLSTYKCVIDLDSSGVVQSSRMR